MKAEDRMSEAQIQRCIARLATIKSADGRRLLVALATALDRRRATAGR